jgi:hypothetical protein
VCKQGACLGVLLVERELRLEGKAVGIEDEDRIPITQGKELTPIRTKGKIEQDRIGKFD